VDPGKPPDDAAQLVLQVRPQEIDPLAHVNNAVYLDWVEEAVIGAVIASGGDAAQLAVLAIPRTVRIEYARAAEPGSAVRLATWRDGDGERRGWWVRMRDAAGVELVRAYLEG
jgi:acyl-CoA thioesterase FadM